MLGDVEAEAESAIGAGKRPVYKHGKRKYGQGHRRDTNADESGRGRDSHKV